MADEFRLSFYVIQFNVQESLKAGIMTRHNVIYVKALFSRAVPWLYQVPVNSQLTDYIKLITVIIFPFSASLSDRAENTYLDINSIVKGVMFSVRCDRYLNQTLKLKL